MKSKMFWINSCGESQGPGGMGLFLFFTSFLFAISTHGQGMVNLFVTLPVTNIVTGMPADSTIVGALYYGPRGAVADTFLPALPASPFFGGYPQFGGVAVLPLPPGALVDLQIRAWSSGYPTYEAAVGSGSQSVLVGNSIVHPAQLWGAGFPPPFDPEFVQTFIVIPIPEPAPAILGALAASLLWCFRRPQSSGAEIN